MGDVYVALLHHPVYDKNRSIVTTSITSRLCTFRLTAFWLLSRISKR